MLVLVGKSPTTIKRDYPHPNAGILASPRRIADQRLAATLGFQWASDNDCYNGGLDEPAFIRMIDTAEGTPGCLFIVAPDVVADAEATLEAYDDWAAQIHQRQLPVALALQDGMTPDDIWWPIVDAVFVGGSTEWKQSDAVRRIVNHAQVLNKWVHMGRVNTRRRFKLAKAWGCDSVDGTSSVMFTDTHLPWQLEYAAAATQEAMI